MQALSILKKILHISKATAVEQALISYAQQQAVKQHPLLKYAGTIDKKSADEILKAITSSKSNKDIDLDL